jgi:hypothetical protein
MDTSTPNRNEVNEQLQEINQKYNTLIKEFSKIQNYPYDKKNMSKEEILDIFTKLKKLQQFSKFISEYIPETINKLEDYII